MISFASKIGATSMTPAGNNMTWVMDYNSPSMYLYKYDVHNEVVKENMFVTVNDSKGIHDMAITDGKMIVTCGDKKVRRISLRGGISEIINTDPFDCRGVCVTNENEIVVCKIGKDKRNHLAVHSYDGYREIQGRDSTGKQHIIEPYRVVQNGLNLCVVNQGHNVVCVNMNGDFQWMYKDEKAKHDEPFNPLGICVDQKNLLVSDHYNRVYQINGEGKLLKLILTDLEPKKGFRFQFHWGICVDDTGRVWVGNANGEIVIANY